MRFAKWKEQELKILEALHKRAVENKENPTLGFRELRSAAQVGTDNLYQRLGELTENSYVATTTIGAYKRYYVTQQGIDYKESSNEVEELLAKKPKIIRFGSEQAIGPTATVYLKNVSFANLEKIVHPAWDRFADQIRKGLEDVDCEISFIGTIKRRDMKKR